MPRSMPKPAHSDKPFSKSGKPAKRGKKQKMPC